jgi:hypothetical protein
MFRSFAQHLYCCPVFHFLHLFPAFFPTPGFSLLESRNSRDAATAQPPWPAAVVFAPLLVMRQDPEMIASLGADRRLDRG